MEKSFLRFEQQRLFSCLAAIGILVLCANLSLAQGRTISGTVKDDAGENLPGVNILIKGTSQGTVTDAEGRFSIASSSPSDILVLSFIGYVTQEVAVGSLSTIDVVLKVDVQTLSEVIVTGYGTQRRADLTGAVATVDMRKASDIPSGSTLQNIQGRVPGLYIQVDGRPSGGARSVLIRGQNTLGATDPLYVIDGVPTTDPNVFQFMDPNAVESVQILKDASAASIYGSRASNGVIIVTTKSGKESISITFNSNLSAGSYKRRLDMMNTEEMGRTLWRASVNDGTPVTAHSARYTYTEHTDANGVRILDTVTPTAFINNDPNIPSGDTDWQKETFRTAITTQNTLTLTGGSQKSSTLVSLGYYTNSGLVLNNDYKRYNARMNNAINFFDGKLKIGENLQIIKAVETPLGGDLGGTAGWNSTLTERAIPSGSSPLALATTIQPLLPVRKLDGTFAGPIGAGFSDRMNPVFLANLDKDDKNHDFQSFGNIFIELLPIDNLVLRSSFGLDYTQNYDVNYEKLYSHGFLNRTINNMSVAQRHRVNWTWSNTANYSFAVDRSRFSVIAGIEAIKSSTTMFGATRQGFAIETLDYFHLSAGTGVANNFGAATGNQLLSYFGKVNYILADKYMASATLRYDGSSRFGENNKFGVFPALSVGWLLSNETFIKNSLPFLSNLKLRAGTGRVGNQEIGDGTTYQQFATTYGTVIGIRATGTAYDINGANTGTLPSGYVAIRTANADLKWETTEEVNVGLDFGMLGQKVSGSFDYFSRTTEDILITPPTPGALGEGATKTVNGATMDNRGFEFSLGYADSKGAFKYSVDGNISRFKDEITYLPSSVVRSYAGNIEKNILGQSRTAVFGYKTDGLFQSAEEVAAHATQPGKGVGRIRYQDLNGDGIIDALDQDWLGTELPGFIYGLNAQLEWKSFTLSVFMRGVAGIVVNDGSKNVTDFLGTTSQGVNKGTRLLDAWTPQNPASKIPAVSLVNNNTETRTSDYFRVRGDYFKVQTIQLNYAFPAALVSTLKLTSLRVYGIADNAILLFKKRDGEKVYTGPDPETPNSLPGVAPIPGLVAYQVYPRPVRYTFGLEVRF